MPTVQLGGVRMHYDEAGASSGRETILFAHGLLWSGRMYAPQMQELADRYRVVAFDFRGQGRTEITESGYDMDTLTDDVVELCDALSLDRVHFVGLSMGGFVGMRLAAYHPDRVRSLSLLATAADPEPPKSARKYALMTLGARAVGTRPFLPAVMKIMFGRTFLHDPARAAERAALEDELANLSRVALPRTVRGVFTRRGVEHLLPKLRVPTLVLSGEEDVAVIPARSRATAAAIPGARFETISRAGHTMTLEQPAAVSAALRGFLEGVRA